jgi:Domain of unknown function (DUF4397)
MVCEFFSLLGTCSTALCSLNTRVETLSTKLVSQQFERRSATEERAIWPSPAPHLYGEETMKNCIRFVFALGLLCSLWSTAGFASSMYVVQGIAGRNYAVHTDPAFPVDVLLNDEVCYVRGLPFGSIQGPLTFEPGTYNIKVSIANSTAPCTNSPLIDRSVTIEPETDYSAAITLNKNGEPILLTFTNNLAPVAADSSRVLFALAANSAAVQVVLENSATSKTYTYTVNPGGLLDVAVPAGLYPVQIKQGTTTLARNGMLFLDSQSVTLLYALGQASNGTVVLGTRTLRDVI